jgi:hypothetical protein
MSYCKEYVEWTNSFAEPIFSIALVSEGMIPGDIRAIECEGIGFVKMLKAEDGDLILEFKDGTTSRYVDVKTVYLKNFR